MELYMTFLGGSEVDVRSKSNQNILTILTLERGIMGKSNLSAFILEHSTFINITSNNSFYHIFCSPTEGGCKSLN
jgi:hypothetical protein